VTNGRGDAAAASFPGDFDLHLALPAAEHLHLGDSLAALQLGLTKSSRNVLKLRDVAAKADPA
jgi:hypothetical protein